MNTLFFPSNYNSIESPWLTSRISIIIFFVRVLFASACNDINIIRITPSLGPHYNYTQARWFRFRLTEFEFSTVRQTAVFRARREHFSEKTAYTSLREKTFNYRRVFCLIRTCTIWIQSQVLFAFTNRLCSVVPLKVLRGFADGGDFIIIFFILVFSRTTFRT